MTDWKSRQNRDGGWAYDKGCSWIEPTAFVLLAQSVTQVDQGSFQAGVQFLLSTQREDGGWTPQPGVAESTWVTALVALLPEQAIGERRLNRAIAWLNYQSGRESGWAYRFRQWVAGSGDRITEGWPWFPGAAAWVIPTSLGILAFERALSRRDSGMLRARVNEGREYLLSHMCADGGWNHGSFRALGRDGESYPETTGIALTALRHAPRSAQMERAKAAARRHLATCRTAEGLAWLRMGLAAQGENAEWKSEPRARTTMDAALVAIAAAARNPLLT